jgi:hypothetical protein
MALNRFPDKSDAHWRRSLDQIAKSQVIPVIGPELLQVRVRHAPFSWARQDLRPASRANIGLEPDEWLVPWEAWVASALAKKLVNDDGDDDEIMTKEQASLAKIWPHADTSQLRLSTLVGRALRAGIPLADLRSYVTDIAQKLDIDPNVRPSPLLLRLASITEFQLYVTTGFDQLIEKALKEANRPPQKPQAYYRKDPQKTDLAMAADSKQPVVYHLLGLPSAWDEFALSEEDLLEWLPGMQMPDKGPQRLFEKLHSHHLLLLGCNFPDWLGRFILRLTRRERLGDFQTDQTPERTVVETNLRNDVPLREFLDLFTKGISFFDKDADVFVERLATKWLERQNEKKEPLHGEPALGSGEAEIAEGNKPLIFLSYARADEEFARSLYNALRKVKLRVWFDKEDLGPGAPWELRIGEAVDACAFFLPVMSKSAVSGEPGRYLHYEWNRAQKRYEASKKIGEFIIPVSIDGTNSTDPELKAMDGMLASQWTPLSGPDSMDKFVESMRKLVRKRQTR